MKQRKTLSSWLTTKYQLVVRDEENFEEKATLRFNYVRIALVLGLSFIMMFLVSMLLAKTVLANWFDPSVEFSRTDRVLIQLEERVDSLMLAMDTKDRYIENIRNVLQGNVSLEQVSLEKGAEYKPSEVNLSQIHPIDSQFRKEFEEIDYDQLSFKNNTREELNQIFFFPPISGVVTNKFSVKDNHFGTDLVAKKNEPIKSVAEGSVILSSWTQDSGNVIAIQHKYNIISFYKHNSVLLKKVGETVKAGELIAIIGNSGEYTDGPHLHFELWYNGNPVNPEDFIHF